MEGGLMGSFEMLEVTDGGATREKREEGAMNFI